MLHFPTMPFDFLPCSSVPPLDLLKILLSFEVHLRPFFMNPPFDNEPLGHSAASNNGALCGIVFRHSIIPWTSVLASHQGSPIKSRG